MPCWILCYPRPIGVEPTIYLTEPKLDPNPDDPFHPTVEIHGTVKSALRRIMDFNDTSEYLKDLVIK